ncbi:MAG: ribonuclease E inhibitor RraB [Paucibacter sp.]|nr:ribonuclease E inhibitor RraB [Roseateles sp.]
MKRFRTIKLSDLNLALLLAGCLALIPLPSWAQRAPSISQSQLESMFANMRAKTPWNVDGPLLWGFFFVDPDKGKLDAVANELVSHGYRLVDITPRKGGAEYWLHVERVETLTPASLYARNIEFEALARRYEIRTYDGMDVGPAPTPASAASGAGLN